MKFLGHFFNFYLDASIHVSLAVISFFWATIQILNIPMDGYLFSFVFFSSVGSYNFIKYGIALKKYGPLSNRYHRNIRFFSLACLGIAVYPFFFLGWETNLVLALLGILTGLYALPVLPGPRNFRSLGISKVLLVALVWSGATVFLPVVSAHIPIHWDVWIEGVQRFLVVFVLVLPFEVRDMAYDTPGLLTIPRLYGSYNTKILGLGLGVFFFSITFLKDQIGTNEVCAKGILFLMLGMVLLATKRNQGKYFASFWVESVPILWGICIWSLGI